MEFIYSITEPILAPARGFLNKIFKGRLMVDFSPILVWIVMDYIIVPVVIKLVYYIF